MKYSAVAVLLVLVTITALALGSALGASVFTSQKTTTENLSFTKTITETTGFLSFTTFTQTVTTTATLAINYSTSLDFVMSVNSSTVQQRHNLTVFVGVRNALNSSNKGSWCV